MEIQFLTLAEVLEIHQDQIARFGGTSGIRDIELLKSALGMPAAAFGGEYLHPDLYAMAAAYVFHIVKNHPFIDANKRVGAMVAIVFLELNGIELSASEEDLAEMVLSVARGECDKAAVTDFLRKWSVPLT